MLLVPNLSLTALTITFLWACNWLGLIYLAESITRVVAHKSLINLVGKSKKNLLLFALASVSGGVIIEGIGQWIGKLWFYPFFTLQQYSLVCIPGFALYMLTIAECYLAAKTILDRLIKTPRQTRKYFFLEKMIYPKFLMLGAVCILLSLGLGLTRYHENNGYFFDPTHYSEFKVNFLAILLMPFGVWLVCEYFEYKRHETSFLKDILRQYVSPVFAVLLATIVVGISMELINVRYGYWVYVNWPLQDMHIFGLPIVMLCIAWPIHFIMFLSLFRVVATEDSTEVWRPSSHTARLRPTRARKLKASLKPTS